jgi:POT family proton-dependent oligopeptide transporter
MDFTPPVCICGAAWGCGGSAARRATAVIGGILIGPFCLGVPLVSTFFIGLVLVVLGTGLLKPNISTMVGQLYPEGGARRDAGFTIFYMGINLGAALGPVVCSSLGEKVNWHYGFTAAGVGMVLGLVQFRLTRHHLGEAGREPGTAAAPPGLDSLGRARRLLTGDRAGLAGILTINPLWVAQRTTMLIVGMAIAYSRGLSCSRKLDPVEKARRRHRHHPLRRSAMFWSGLSRPVRH